MSSHFFSKNMEALQKQHPDLATDIQKAIPKKYTIKKRQTKGGFFLDLCIDGSCFMWQHTITKSVPSKKAILFLGAGNGYVCLQYLKQQPSVKIVIWDCEIERLHLLLQFCDLSTYIEQNRLKIIFGVELFSFHGLYHKKRIITSTLPMLKELVQGIHFLKLFQLPQWKRNLFLVGEGGLYVEDLCNYIHDRGDLPLIMSMRLWQLKYILKWKPQGLFTINFVPGLEHFCEANKLPYACWEIDPNMDPMERYPMQTKKYEYSKMFTYRKKHIAMYERLGLPSQYLPLAAPVYRKEVFAVDPMYKQNLTFVGSSMNNEGKKSIAKLHSILETKMSLPDIRNFITRAILHQKNHPDTYLIDDYFAKNLSQHKTWFPKENLPILLGEYCASLRRLEYCTMVAKWGLDVWGDSGWEEIKDSGARIRGKVGYFEAINHVYSNGGIHLDINRLYQNDMITLRVFEVLACGGFILAEYSEALEELFDIGTEIEAWRTKEELLDKIDFYIDKPNLRDTIRRKGQSIVHQRHMFAQKMNYIMEHMPSPEAGEI